MIKKMKKLYRVICGNYRKFGKPKISCLLKRTLVLSIICSKRKNEDDKQKKQLLKKKKQLKYYKFFV